MGANRIEEEASRWLALCDAAGARVDDAAFAAWMQADIRHRVAYLRLESSWKRAARLRDLRPLDRDIDPDLLRRRRSPWASLATAAALLLVVCAAWIYAQRDWNRYETSIGGFSRIVLEDGSVIDLNTDSVVRVRIGAARREVELIRGEGRFQVAHDAQRPFIVTAADASVRAIGTAFTVRLRDETRIDVLVSEGRVAIDATQVPRTPPVNAGEAAVVLPGKMSVRRIEKQAIQRRLAWTSGRIELRGETLADAIAEFNRYNRRPLVMSDAGLASLRVGGSFAATDPESFAAALAGTFHLRVVPTTDAIVLQPP